MTQFIQLHFLVSYPPSNPNRDDLGRPKTAIMGGAQRLRISSQSLKRAWRTSDVFEESLEGSVGVRTKEIGSHIKKALMDGCTLRQVLDETKAEGNLPRLPESEAKKMAWSIASVFVDKIKKDDDEEAGEEPEEGAEEGEEGKKDKKEKKKEKGKKSNVGQDTLKGEQIVFYSVSEISAIDSLLNVLRSAKRPPTEQEQKALLKKKEDQQTSDLALFGRMLANSPAHNTEAACQVAHAITTHKVAVEDDFFTAVDDLNKHDVDAGSAHMGETEFSSGLFYLYVCIDKTLLLKNLQENTDLANKTLAALLEAAATVAPSGKQNSFANRVRASYILAEKGCQQPRSLSVAFLKPVYGEDVLQRSIEVLTETQKNMDQVYGKCADHSYVMNATKPEKSSLKGLIEFVQCRNNGNA